MPACLPGAEEAGGRRGQRQLRQLQRAGEQGPRPVRGVAAGGPVGRRRSQPDRSCQGRRLHRRAQWPSLFENAMAGAAAVVCVFLTPDLT